MASGGLEEHLQALRKDYRDLQHAAPDVFKSPPSVLEALRMVNKAHPAVIKSFSPISLGGPSSDPDWSLPRTYETIGGDREVTIAVTDDGLADSVRELDDGTTTFVKPLEEKMIMSTVLSRLRDSTEAEILYLQSQDGNVYRSQPRAEGEQPELAMFQKCFERDIPWMRQAIGATAEAVNLWIGSSRSTTSFHHDPYENIYHVLSGSKTFTLLSPIEGLWLDQHFHPSSTLHRAATGLIPVSDPPPAHPVPWVTSHLLPPGVDPIVITIHESETLFLPAGWWHRVEQSPGKGGLAVAVNYWYPAEIRAETYAYERFVRRVARVAGREGVIMPSGDEEAGPFNHDDLWGSEGSAEEWDPREWGR